jgi:5-oxopent-3-ene-1,2,5-tricarboxylate decarboxylase/2-hydroxyhepta-2,4-diene-1,7-dioate isomerase
VHELLLYVRARTPDHAPVTELRRVRVAVDGTPCWGRRDGDEIVLDGGRAVPEGEVSYLAPVEPSKVIAVHLTYRSRVDEYAANTPPAPSYFMKPPSALNGHRAEIRRPHGTRFLNYEGGLAVVVGRRMKGVGIDDVLGHVAGYAPANDVGLHDFRHADRGSMLRVKGQDGFCPIGPGLVSGVDVRQSRVRTYVNGAVVQDGPLGEMTFGIDYLVADLCRHITLLPGDIVLTGTPANSRPMEPGDVVAVEIDGLGRVENTVVDWDVDLSGPGEMPTTSAQTLHVALAIPEDEAEQMIA